MNAHTRLPPSDQAFSHDIVAMAKRFDRHPFAAAPDRRQCFDCVTLINLLTGADIHESWMRDGGPLPFDAIDPRKARAGDVIVFRMNWPDNPHHLALLTSGRGVDDAKAQIFGPWFGHAAATCWLRAWRPYVTGAYRIVGAA